MDERGEVRSGDSDADATGIVLQCLTSGNDPRLDGANRIALILEDPVDLLANTTEPSGRPGDPGAYTPAFAGLIGELGDRVLVIAARELTPPGGTLHELFAHLGVRPGDVAQAPGVIWPHGPTGVSPGERSRLFATVREDVEQLERLVGRTFRHWRFGGPSADTRPVPVPAPTPRSLFYRGRSVDVAAPPNVLVLDAWDVLPVSLGAMLDEADSLTVLDPMSFPFDSLRAPDRDIPLAVELPRGWPTDVLVQLLGQPLLSHLGPFDLITAPNDRSWSELREKYSWPANIRVGPAQMATVTSRLSGTPPGSARRRKAAHRMLAASLRPQLAAGYGAVPTGGTLSAMVLSDHVDR